MNAAWKLDAIVRAGARLLFRRAAVPPSPQKHLQHKWGPLDARLIGAHLGAAESGGLLDNRKRIWRSR